MPTYTPPQIPGLVVNTGNVAINDNSADQDFRIESDNDTHVLFVEGDSDRVAVGTDDPQGKFHVRNSATNEYTALFENTDEGASAAPDVALYRNSLSPANGDDLGHLIWRGTTDDGDSTVTRTNITDIFSELQVATTGAESGKMHLRTKMAGTMKKRITIAATETVVNEDAQNADFRVESTGNQNMLRVDASADRVGIGTGSPKATLHVVTTGTDSNIDLATDDEVDNINGLLIESTANHSANSGPIIAFYRNGGDTQAPGSVMGNVLFMGEDDGDAPTIYGQWKTWTIKSANGQESYAMAIQGLVGGTNRGFIHCLGAVDDAGVASDYGGLLGPEVVINQNAQDIDFRVESSASPATLFTEGSSGKVGIGTSTPVATLDVAATQTFRNTRLLTESVSANTPLTEIAHAGRYNICAGDVALPSTSTAGEHYAVLNTTGGNITIFANGNNINGAGADFTLATYKAATCIAIGSNNWMVVG